MPAARRSTRWAAAPAGRQRAGREPPAVPHGAHPGRTSDEQGDVAQQRDRERSIGTAATAPLPSPRRIPTSRSGSRPSSVERERLCRLGRAVAGGEPGTGTRREPFGGQRAGHATSARRAAPGPRLAAASARKPAVAARSALPSAARLSTGSSTRPPRGPAPRDRRRSCAASAASSMPVPRPVTSSAGRPSAAATSAAAGVVLPMPMSPRDQQLGPGRDLLGGDLAADLERRAGLRGRQGVLDVDRARARAGPCERRTSAGRSARSASTAEVEHTHRHAVGPRQRRDTGPPGEEGADHGRGHGRRVGRDAVRGDAVVAGEDHGADVVDSARRHLALGCREPDAESPRRPRAPAGVARPASRSWARASTSLEGGRMRGWCWVSAMAAPA